MLAELLLWSFHYKGIFHEVYVYSHRLRTLFVAGEHCDYDTVVWARRIFHVSRIHYFLNISCIQLQTFCLQIHVSLFALIKHLIISLVFSQYIIFMHSLTMSFLVT